MDINAVGVSFVSDELSVPLGQVQKVLDLLVKEESTIPFIARYRKEATGGLDEVQVEKIQKSYNDYLEREKRRSFILSTLKEQDKLTKDLERLILEAKTINQLEDIYAPYKSKRKTKGQLAIEAGLSELASILKSTKESLAKIEKKYSSKFINKEFKIETFEDAIEGAKNILVEEITHHVELKDYIRGLFWKVGTLKSSLKKNGKEVKDSHKFNDYFDFEQKVSELRISKNAHRFLAMRRGMTLKILKVEVQYEKELLEKEIGGFLFDQSLRGCQETLDLCVSRGATLIHTSLDLEIKGELKKLADESAINVFGINLRNLLLQPYLGAKAVMGIDPGVRTGCKIALIDKNGNFLIDSVIYPHAPQNDVEGAKKIINTCLEKFNIEYFAVGNGTFGRETLEFLEEHIERVKDGKVKAMLVNEDGASIYSASEIARKEFPDKDLTVRGAISIARRFQDPLGELVKIEPKSIGVGQYQHDVAQTQLKKSLKNVVENCVNYVGVDLNTASGPLLSYISGIGPTLATNIVKEREKKKGFTQRKELLEVPRMSAKIFEQAAGFLRIYRSKNPLDGTFIHPERYGIIDKWCQEKSLTLKELVEDKKNVERLKSDSKLREQLGNYTHDDIVSSLIAPVQDPRTEFKPFDFRKDIKSINDLKVNQWYPGIVSNITRFGAFVDIGIKDNGLIHVSEMADKFVEDALEVLKVGQEVMARVISLDMDRKRISLSLKKEERVQKVKVKKEKPQMRNSAFGALKKFKLKG